VARAAAAAWADGSLGGHRPPYTRLNRELQQVTVSWCRHYFLKNSQAFARLIRWRLLCHIFGHADGGICDRKFIRKDEAQGAGNSETWTILAAPSRCFISFDFSGNRDRVIQWALRKRLR
jgi:hypothetical protein